jgi:hypothetical protein
VVDLLALVVVAGFARIWRIGVSEASRGSRAGPEGRVPRRSRWSTGDGSGEAPGALAAHDVAIQRVPSRSSRYPSRAPGAGPRGRVPGRRRRREGRVPRRRGRAGRVPPIADVARDGCAVASVRRRHRYLPSNGTAAASTRAIAASSRSPSSSRRARRSGAGCPTGRPALLCEWGSLSALSALRPARPGPRSTTRRPPWKVLLVSGGVIGSRPCRRLPRCGPRG